MLTMRRKHTGKKAAFARVLNEREEKELAVLALSRVLLIRKEKGKKTVNIDKIIFYLKLCIQHIMKSQELLLIISNRRAFL